jgi:hypothetical protein
MKNTAHITQAHANPSCNGVQARSQLAQKAQSTLTRDEERRLKIGVPVLRDLCVEWDGFLAKEGWKFSLSREAGQPVESEYYEVIAYPA